MVHANSLLEIFSDPEAGGGGGGGGGTPRVLVSAPVDGNGVGWRDSDASADFNLARRTFVDEGSAMRSQQEEGVVTRKIRLRFNYALGQM